jgi:cytochrome c553
MPLAFRTALACLALYTFGAPAWAQTADDPVAGRTLFNNTPSSGGAGITMSCPACHGSVEDRRARISGTNDPFADISFDTAMTRFAAAAQNQSEMAQFRTLTQQQARNIAAYLADTPETLPEHESQLSFTATAVNTTSAAQTVTIRHAVATNDTLTIVGVAAIGTEAGNFSVQPACNGLVLQPAGSCALTVSYAPRNANPSAPDLVVTLRQGSSQTTFERVLFLSGSIAGAPPAGGGNDDSGGGALDARWLAALALAVGLLARGRRRA